MFMIGVLWKFGLQRLALFMISVAKLILINVRKVCGCICEWRKLKKLIQRQHQKLCSFIWLRL